ncbi:MAG TPA: VTC domain-containing protein [Candidatus Brocadiaceae bacterium]
MNRAERYERRYFFVNTLNKEVEMRIENVEGILRVEYPNPVTETIYFTHGQKMAYAMPSNQFVRIRRYMGSLSETMEFGSESIFFEVKTNHATGMNCKERISIAGDAILSVLAKETQNVSISNILQNISHLLPLFPTAATQAERQHWVHKSGIRITLDREIRMFVFPDGSLKGYFVKSLEEGKLEFKFPKSFQSDSPLVNIIVAVDNNICVQKDQGYLERRIRECFFQSMIKGSMP